MADTNQNSASADRGDRLYVAVVDNDRTVREGLVRMLERDSRLHVMDPFAEVTELGVSGVQFDACVLGLSHGDRGPSLADLPSGVPTVISMPAEHWRVWVQAWANGAGGVVSRDVAGVSLADAVCDAVFRPEIVHPQLARALVDCIAECGVEPDAGLKEVLERVAEGRPTLSVLRARDIPFTTYVGQMIRLRASCLRAGLEMPASVRRTDGDGRALAPSFIPPEALALTGRIREVLRHYADGYSYAEIADLLHIGENTVKSHVLTALDKFGIMSNRSGEVRLMFAMYISGRHSRPELVRRRLDALRRSDPSPTREGDDRRKTLRTAEDVTGFDVLR